jgi:hypothetical protein
MTPPEETALQPLREVGTEDKSQFWDMEDVMQALRVANRRGIPLTDLNGLHRVPLQVLLKAS